MSPVSLAALGVCLSCYQAAVYDGQGLHGSLCFTWTVFDCVSAGGVVGPVSHSLFPLQQLLQDLCYKADFRKCTVNILVTLAFVFWTETRNFKMLPPFLFTLLFLIVYRGSFILRLNLKGNKGTSNLIVLHLIYRG